MHWTTQLFATLIMLLAMFLLYRYIKNQPQAFSKANLSKSLTTMGMLALGLIAFIGLCILLLRS